MDLAAGRAAPGPGRSALAREHCQPVRPGTSALSHFDIEELADELEPGWHVNDDLIRREYVTHDFAEAFAFATRIALLAEAEGHHPELTVAWGRLVVTLSTHAARGLTRNDFVLAARIDALGGP
ncbi:MAG TPA: 4a-hydroxytetrahydrobiopterin dehydratase [Candidatus Sulfotelmatobacter sp.]|nr:4a-hydroxytetrahydrobiopterin dehydratase [Candidatus Sulfotelmatobacter sp.]